MKKAKETLTFFFQMQVFVGNKKRNEETGVSFALYLVKKPI